MFLGKVLGNVVATIKNKNLDGTKLMLIRQTDVHGTLTGKPQIAVDTVDAGEGDTVILMKEGGSARKLLKRAGAPVNLVIVGVVDTVDLGGWTQVAK